MAKKSKNLNYNFYDVPNPKKRMGAASFANLPDRPIMASYGPPSYRGGLINSFTSSLSEVSGIDENGSMVKNGDA